MTRSRPTGSIFTADVGGRAAGSTGRGPLGAAAGPGCGELPVPGSTGLRLGLDAARAALAQRCGTADAALALVDAIQGLSEGLDVGAHPRLCLPSQERQALLRALTGALRAREELRGAVLAHEQLAACAEEPADAPAVASLRDRAGRAAAAPAAWLALAADGGSAGRLAPGPGERQVGALAALNAELWGRYFQAWLAAADERRDLWRATRRDAASRLLGTRSRAIALRQLLKALPFTSEHAIPRDLPRDELVRDTARERTGTFLSATDAGVCKVRFGDHVELMPAGRLVWRRSGPHPFVGGLCLLAWALATRQRGERHLAQLRQRMLTGGGSGARPLARLAAASEDAAVGRRVFFEAWAAACRAARASQRAVLAEAWAAWRGALAQARHAAAKAHFEGMTREFGAARLAVARQTRRHELLERKLAEIGSLQGQFWSSWVLQEGVRTALWLVRETSSGPRLALCFRAWAAARRQERGRRRFLARNMAQAQKSTASRHFLEWKVLVRLERQQSAERALRARDGEFRQREVELSRVRGMLGEGPRLLAAAVGRVEQLEASLQAAERAIEHGARHAQGLERQAARLERESATPAALAEERGLLAAASRERDEARQEEGGLREELARERARLGELLRELQQEREQRRALAQRQEEEARERRREQATSGPLRRQPRVEL
ncbi:unnamed protein product [Prorocentrum cordatum]|uniref:Uncharacterized protein n=1 Tax=Prorocentrum cordatum TaxID=2364126 RepID=A0ABN9PBJ1_9DINO|nr:unnamed protein product [Polarella glacialis]